MRNATLKDVAALAGVGVSTASYVLSKTGLHKVGPAARQRILQAAEKLHYRPNSVARELKSGQCRLVALLLPGVNYSFMPELLQGIEEVLCDHHYNALLSTYRTEEEFAESCRILSQQRIAGGICNPAGDQKMLDLLERYFPDMPWVICASASAGHYPGVWVPAGDVGRIGIEYLLQKNHRRIGCFLPGSRRWELLESLSEQYKLNSHETFIWLQADPHDPAAVLGELSALKKCAPEKFPTALFFNGDLEAAEFMTLARAHGLRIPEDISILGVNGSPLCKLLTPQLTSVEQPRSGQGRMSALNLLEWIKTSRRPETLNMTASIQEGGSVKAL